MHCVQYIIAFNCLELSLFSLRVVLLTATLQLGQLFFIFLLNFKIILLYSQSLFTTILSHCY